MPTYYVPYFSITLSPALHTRHSIIILRNGHTFVLYEAVPNLRDLGRFRTSIIIIIIIKHCATGRKVAGLIPDGVIGFFHRHNPSGRTMALGST